MRPRQRGTAKRAFKATECGHRVEAGAACFFVKYRERALSYREASHAGTMYPTRIKSWCADCGEAERAEHLRAVAEDARVERALERWRGCDGEEDR